MFLLILLSAIIGGYIYLTDSNRVRDMAQSYLSQVLGGPVEVGNATLSIFQGLRLDDIKVRVDRSDQPDAMIFSARTFLINYDPRSIIRGKLEATQIVAIDPRIHLVENLDTRGRNYQRMQPETRPATPSTRPRKPLVLPEILLRNAQIEYAQIEQGHYQPLGAMRIEGRLSPDDEEHLYSFDLQSRGEVEGLGPLLSGSVSMSSGRVHVTLRNFEFSHDLRMMLLAQVRRWWQEHELSGRIERVELDYVPGSRGQRPSFRVETLLDNVSLTVRPREWLSRAENQRLLKLRDTAQLLRRVGLNLNGDVDYFTALLEPAPVQLEKVTGTFVFTEDGIDIQTLKGRVETNALKISGRIDGYSPDAPAHLQVASLDSESIYVPRAPRYIRSLPEDMRELYDHLRPEGTCSIKVNLDRPTAGAKPLVRGEVRILEGNFVFDEFPYPLRDVTGLVTFGPDPATGKDRCDIRELRGRGIKGTVNEDVLVTVNGSVAPLGDGSEVMVMVEGANVVCDPDLKKAFPSEVRDVLKMFDPAGNGEYPQFRGKFRCEVHRPRGRKVKWEVVVHLALEDASGAFVLFPYPLRNVKGELEILGDKVLLKQITARHGPASLLIDGAVGFGKNRPITPELKITARDVPINEDFLNAVPPGPRQLLKTVGLAGVLNIDGRVFRAFSSTPVAALDASTGSGSDSPALNLTPESEITYDLSLALRDGAIFRTDDGHALTQLTGQARLTPSQLNLVGLRAKRDSAAISADGLIADLDHVPRLQLLAQARELMLDEALYRVLPRGARQAWDQVQPWGTVDAEMRVNHSFADAPATRPTTRAPVPSTQSALPSTQAAFPSSQPAVPAFELVLHPLKMSAIPRAVPYRLDDLSGTITIRPDLVVLDNMAARHGEAKITLAGTGTTDDASVWDLSLGAENAVLDEEFRTAIPEALRSLIDALKLKGRVSFHFSKMLWRTTVEAHAPATSRATTRPDTESDVDWAGQLVLHGASLEAGVPMSDVDGKLDLAGTIRAGRLAGLAGRIDLPALKLGGRDVTHLHSDILKPPDQPAMQLSKLEGELAGGNIAGQVDFTFPDAGPSQYALNIVLRNAQVQQLVPDTEHDIQGQLTASLSLEGRWDDSARRRGRGDVLVSGKRMYRIPVVLGLLQITNLALPISAPFSEGSARYSVEGPRVTFETIELRSDSMTMQGGGYLDFANKQVRMTFVTDNPNGLQVPFLTELFRGVKQELFQIHVNGTIETPQVGARMMNTFQTTIDEVLKGDNPPARKK